MKKTYGKRRFGRNFAKAPAPNNSVPGLLTVSEAAKKCRISFAHAWWMVTTKRWNTVRVGPNLEIIRVRESDVTQTIDRWRNEDAAARERARGRKRHARKSAA